MYKPLSDSHLNRRVDHGALWSSEIDMMIEQCRRANRLAAAVQVTLDTRRSSISAESDLREMQVALREYLGED